MRVIWVKVGENPTVVSIPHQLEYMQELVGGLIEVVEPFSDDVVLVCNENGRIEDRPFCNSGRIALLATILYSF